MRTGLSTAVVVPIGGAIANTMRSAAALGEPAESDSAAPVHNLGSRSASPSSLADQRLEPKLRSEQEAARAEGAPGASAGAVDFAAEKPERWLAVGLRYAILPVLISVMVACTVVIAFVTMKNADLMADSLNSQLLVHVGYRVQSEVQRVFMEAVQAVEHTAWMAALTATNEPASVKPADFPDIVRDARTAMHTFSSIASLSLVLVDGSGFAVRPEDTPAFWAMQPTPVEPLRISETGPAPQDPSVLNAWSYYFAAGRAGAVTLDPPARSPFDPRKRPYWTSVGTKQEPAWAVFASATTGISALAYSLPFFHSLKPLDRPEGQGMQGILAATLNVASLNRFVSDLVVTPNGIALVMAIGPDGRRYVVAYRDPRGPRPPHDPSFALLPIRNCTNDLIRAFAESLGGVEAGSLSVDPTTGLKVAVGGFDFGGASYTSRTVPMTIAPRASAGLYSDTSTGKALQVLVAVASPHDDFKGFVGAASRVAIGVGTASCVFVAGLILLVSIEITRQLRLFTKEVETVSSLRVPLRGPGERLRSRLRELHLCADAIEKLRSMIGIVAGMTDAVVVLGANGSVTKVNARAMQVFQISERGSISGQPTFADLFLSPDPDTQRRFGDFLKGEGSIWTQQGGPTGSNTREFLCRRLASRGLFPAEISVGSLAASGAAADAAHVLVVRDVTERQSLLSNVRASESRATALASDLRNLVEHSNAPIVGVTADGRVDEWNAAMERITGCPRGEALDRPLAAFAAGACREAFAAAIAGVLERGEEVSNLEVEVVQAPGADDDGDDDGPPARLMVSGAARRDAAGAITGGIFVGQDMSEKLRVLQMAAAADAKARLIAYVCHEVRTPLNGITGMTQVLGDTDLSADQRDSLQLISQCSEQLLSVVNDLLDISKLEAGKVTLEKIPFDLREIAEGVCELVAPACYTKGIEIVCHVPTEMPTRVRGDPTRVRQILINLAHNACKFTSRGHVLVSIELMGVGGLAVAFGSGAASAAGSRAGSLTAKRELLGGPAAGAGSVPGSRQVSVTSKRGASAGSPRGRRARRAPHGAGPDEAWFRLSVADTGMGMDEAGLGRLFRDFVQVNETITRKFGGTGMGLSICKQLAELMGGRIYATSTLGEGTTFVFEVCFAVDGGGASELSESPSVPSPTAAPSPAMLAFGEDDVPPRVLVATACPPIREAFAAYAAALGCRADFATAADEARAMLSAAGEGGYGACVVDESLPASREAEAAPPGGSPPAASPAQALLRELAEGSRPRPVLLSSANRRGSLLTPTGDLRPGGGPAALSPVEAPGFGPTAARPGRRTVAWLCKPLRLAKLATLLRTVAQGIEPGSETAPAPLDLGPPATEPVRSGPIRSAPDSKPRLRVLLVEDQAFNQKVVEAMLRKHPIDIEVAWDGVEAVEKFGARQYDLVLMDMQMPRLDGVGATVEIRRMELAAAAEAGPDGAAPARPRTPIVALTANALSGDERRCLSAGMDAFLRKPIRAEELLSTIEGQTGWRRPAERK